MRKIDYIVLHCTATAQNATVKAIQNYWKNSLGWKNPGYHHIIEANGKVHDLQPIEKPSNGVAGYNANSIHISYIGGITSSGKAVDNRTDEQKTEMIKLLQKYTEMFPKAKVQGHRDFPKVAKACPCFDAIPWWNETKKQIEDFQKQLRKIYPAHNEEYLKRDEVKIHVN